ncbi:Immunoglobulin Superfamily Containing Leucine-Rich Repeat Protein [Manis pentadactyla]|nr:Immunoglobulin Superfamily Containing Leucine-Rich Repeat Protein [Manis pentadactyla]
MEGSSSLRAWDAAEAAFPLKSLWLSTVLCGCLRLRSPRIPKDGRPLPGPAVGSAHTRGNWMADSWQSIKEEQQPTLRLQISEGLLVRDDQLLSIGAHSKQSVGQP